MFMTFRAQHQTSFTQVFILICFTQRDIASMAVRRWFCFAACLVLLVFSIAVYALHASQCTSDTFGNHLQRNSMMSSLQHVFRKVSRDGRQCFFLQALPVTFFFLMTATMFAKCHTTEILPDLSAFDQGFSNMRQTQEFATP